MKKLAIPYIIFLYLTQWATIAFIVLASVFGNTDTPDHPSVYIMLAIAIGLGIVSIIIGFMYFIFGLIAKYDAHKTPYKMTMITKLVLVPFFIINFTFGLMLSIGMFSMLLMPFVLITLITGTVLTYGILLATSSYNIAYMYKAVKNNHKKWSQYALYFILHFFFVADVVSSVMLYSESRKDATVAQQNTTELNQNLSASNSDIDTHTDTVLTQNSQNETSGEQK